MHALPRECEKPNPEGLLKICSDFGVDPKETLVVGDSLKKDVAVAKKVGFLKAAGAVLGLKGFRAVHARAEGAPEKEGLPRADIVISRAFMDLPQWVPLGSRYVSEQGRLVAMLGQAPRDAEALGAAHGFSRVRVRGYALPYSKATRHVAVFER